MIERTEELGLAARLTIAVGGQPTDLRTLNLEESEKWLAKLNKANIDVEKPVAVMLALVEAYDIDGHLGTGLRKRFTQRELYDAVNQMVRAEAPFQEESRSVAQAFGANVQFSPLMHHQLVQSLQASSTSSPLPNGDSIQQGSAKASPKNVSSSSGPTAKNA